LFEKGKIKITEFKMAIVKDRKMLSTLYFLGDKFLFEREQGI